MKDGGNGAAAYADAVITYLAFALDKCVDYWNSIATWAQTGEFIRNCFARQAIAMSWDFAECNVFSKSTANWGAAIEWVAKAVKEVPARGKGRVSQADATATTVDSARLLISTDPPYYDNVPYADLSDFFYVWLRKSLGHIYPDLFGTMLVPKGHELIADQFRYGTRDKAKAFFEEGLGKAFARIHELQHADYPITVYYAFKQTEVDETDNAHDNTSSIASTGWQTMLDALLNAGLTITGTWPTRTERGARPRDHGSNALASSIVLVCRPRPEDAALTTRRDFLNALKHELPKALKNLQHGNVAPVDLAQAAIGPGMAIFSRYSKVLEADGSPMRVRTALQLINQALDQVLAEQEGEFDADTRWAITWFEQYSHDEGAYGIAETLSKAKNTAIIGLVEAGFLSSRAGKVRLLRRDELAADWDPSTDPRLTVWEVAQHLIHALDQGGEMAAAALLGKVGVVGDVARDLAYRLYTTCERKGWAQEALAYNSLVVAWPELSRLASQPVADEQTTFLR